MLFQIAKFLGICGQIMYSSDGYAFPETFYLGMYIDNNSSLNTATCPYVTHSQNIGKVT